MTEQRLHCKVWVTDEAGHRVAFTFQATPPPFADSIMTGRQYHEWLKRQAMNHVTITARDVLHGEEGEGR